MSRTPDTDILPHADYRSSHLAEGEAYHAKFEQQIYRALMWELERETLSQLLAERTDRATCRLLDFACGTGRVLAALEPQVASATGVDISASMLSVAARIAPGAEIVCADITRDPVLDSRQFDVITAFRFFPNAEPALREEAMAKLAGLLAPGGWLIINNHRRRGSLKHRVRLLRSAIGLAKGKDMHTMSDDEVAALAARHGLRVHGTRTAGILPVLKERRPFLPRVLLAPLERWTSGLRALEHLGSHRIYVLAAPAAGEGTRSA